MSLPSSLPINFELRQDVKANTKTSFFSFKVFYIFQMFYSSFLNFDVLKFTNSILFKNTYDTYIYIINSIYYKIYDTEMTNKRQ